MKKDRKKNMEIEMEKKREEKLAKEMEIKLEKRKKNISTIWKIWWIGLIIIFIIVAVQTYIMKFG